MTPSLHVILSRIAERQIPLPWHVSMLLGIGASAMVLGPRIWRVAGHVSTIVHEAAHALTGIAAGRRVRAVKLKPDRSGTTEVVPDSGLGFGLAGFAGYLGPSAAGLIAAAMISAGRIVAVLWLGLGLIVLMLFLVRETFGGILIVACGLALGLIVRFTAVGLQSAVAYGLTWFLLLSGPKNVLEGGLKPQDAQVLARLTRIWPSAWSLFWLAATITAACIGFAILT